MAKEGKTVKKLKSLTTEENQILGKRVEKLIKNELSYIVNYYIMKYRGASFDTFGWDDDDLMQYIRVALWKGLATFNEGLGYKVETYLSCILRNNFANLAKKCDTKKHSMSKIYCPKILYESGEMIFSQTGEDWMRYAQSFKILMNNLTKKEEKVLIRHVVYCDTMTEICENLSSNTVEIVGILKSIEEKMKIFLDEGKS